MNNHPPSTHPSRAWRRRAATSVLVAGGLLFAACGSPPTSGGDGAGRSTDAADNELPECPLDALEAAEGTVDVKMWFGGIVEPPVTVLQEMVSEFNASQDKVKVSAENQGVSYQEVLRKFEGASGTPAQLPDVIYLEDTALGQVVDSNRVLPAQSCMEADGYDPTDITPAARAAFSVDDVLYPGYMNVSSPIIYYNKVHFQKAGLDPNQPPTTLAEVEEFSRQIKEAGVAPKPLSFKADQWFFSTWVAGMGQDVVNNNNGRSAPATEATIDTPETQALLEQLSGMQKDGLMNVFPVTEGKIDHYLALVNEDSSMLIETSTASGTIAQALGGELTAEEAGIDIGSVTLDTQKLVPASGQLPGVDAPGKIYASGGAFYILNAGSPAEQAGAWKFLQFMLQPENAQKWHIDGGYLPVVKSVIDAPEVKEFQETELDGLLLAPSAAQLAGADPDQTSPLIGPYQGYTEAMQSTLEKVLLNGADPKAALADAQSDVDALLKDYNEG